MSDEQEIQGGWTVKFKQWTWDYRFNEKTVKWTDRANNETGAGRWYKAGKYIHISWTESPHVKESWTCPINPAKQGGWIDAPYGVGAIQASRYEQAVPGAMSFDFSVSGGVPLLAQGVGTVCWAAAVSMMIGWRRGNPKITITEALGTMGKPYLSMYNKKMGLKQINFLREAPELEGIDVRQHFTTAAGLKSEPLRSYTPKQLFELLVKSKSPLMTEAHWDSQYTHMYVVKRVYGKGGPQDTTVSFHDPSTGDAEELSFRDFMEKVEGAADQTNIQVWHF